MYDGDLYETRAFLVALCACDGSVAPSSLTAQLARALQEDGYELQHTGNVIRSLRGLAESSERVDVIALVMVGVCILCAGLASGLTQWLLSLHSLDLEIKARSGSEEEKKYAAKLLPIIAHHHQLLVTLMLWNACATEALPIFLSALVPEYVAIITSVTLVLLLGDIIPSSVLSGPNQLQFTASLAPLVYFVLAIFSPLAYPIARGLDYMVGHSSSLTLYSRTEISALMRLHRELGQKRHASDGGHEDSLYEEEEVTIIAGALKYREMMVSQAMTPALQAYMIAAADTLNYKLIYEIFKSGYSRIPVYGRDRNDIVGLILVQDLVFISPEDATPVRSFLNLFDRKPAVVWHDSKLGETLSMFKAEKSHMAIVRDVETVGGREPVHKVVGIITLEDIVEEILGTEIEDETDSNSIMMHPCGLRDAELYNAAAVSKDSLTEEEVHSIGIYLFTNVPQIQRMFRNNMPGLQKLVRSGMAITLTRKAAQGERPSAEDFLYRCGKMSTTCTLVLSGCVEVHEGDGAAAEAGVGAGAGLAVSGARVVTKGPWSILAVGALESAEGSYMPDFTACVASATVRVLRLSTLGRRRHHGRSRSLVPTTVHSAVKKAAHHAAQSMQGLPPQEQRNPLWLLPSASEIVPPGKQPRPSSGVTGGRSSTVNAVQVTERACTSPNTRRPSDRRGTVLGLTSSQKPMEEKSSGVEDLDADLGRAVFHPGGYAPVRREL